MKDFSLFLSGLEHHFGTVDKIHIWKQTTCLLVSLGNALQAKHINANNTDKKRYGVEDIAFFVVIQKI